MNKKDRELVDFLDKKITRLENRCETIERNTRWYLSFMTYLPLNEVVQKICKHLKISVISVPEDIQVVASEKEQKP